MKYEIGGALWHHHVGADYFITDYKDGLYYFDDSPDGETEAEIDESIRQGYIYIPKKVFDERAKKQRLEHEEFCKKHIYPRKG